MTELGVPPTETNGVTAVTADELAELRRSVIGPVFDPGDVELVAELAGYNLALDHAPVAVVGATCAEDVAAAVRWAGGRGIRVGVLATGHGDVSQRGTLVVTTRRLDRVEVDPRTRRATVGAGVKWARLVEVAAPLGLAGLNGSSTDVGITGYTLGGGIGPFIRRYGYASDRVRRIQLVTGDGTVREVTADGDRALFDAMLGGKDAVGIVTELEIELIEVPRMHGGSIFWPAEDTAAVFHAWREWAPTLPEDVTTSVAILRIPDMEGAPPPLRGRTVAHLRFASLLPADESRALLAPMRAVAPPMIDMVDEMTYAAIDTVHMDPPEPMPFRADGCCLADVDAATIDAVLAVAGPQHELPIVLVEVRHIAGAIARGTQGVVPRDRVRFSVGVVAPFVPGLTEVVPAITGGILDALAPWATPCASPNWLHPDRLHGHPELAWDDDQRARLDAVRRRVDPRGVLGAARLGLGG